MPAQLTVADLLPSDLDDFKREGSIATVGADASSATYVNTNDNTERAILAVKPVQQLSGAVLADSLKSAACGDGSGSSTLHVDAHPPFAYATCPPSNGDAGSNFVWVNGQWLFSATSSDPEVLVQFVNLYPY